MIQITAHPQKHIAGSCRHDLALVQLWITEAWGTYKLSQKPPDAT